MKTEEAQRSIALADRRQALSEAVKGATPEQLEQIARVLAEK